MKKPFTFFSGVVFGLIFSMALILYAHTGAALLVFLEPLAQLSQPQSLVRCATQVDTTSWKLYHSTTKGFEFHFPSSYVLQEETGSDVLKVIDEKSKNEISLEKIRGPLKTELLPEMRQAAWKIADRQLFALATPYFTNDDGSLSSTYLFVRDFFPSENTGNYVMIKATIRSTAAAFDAAKKANLVDPEAILTEPEQILSTFRFLQFDELPGRDTGS